MTKIKLPPDHLSVLKAIKEYGPIEVPDLSDKMELDRGKIEGAIASLVKDDLIKRKKKIRELHKLTKRGNNASNGLAERKILDTLSNGPVHMKDLADKSGLEKADLTAGIGILRKNDLITIKKGEVSIKNKDEASTFSVDLQKALEYLATGNDSLENKEVIEPLKSRGLIEIEEISNTIVSTKISKKRLKEAEAVEEVTRLTPQMIADNSWKQAKFKPYSLKTKPRVVNAGRYHPYRQFLELLKSKLIGLGFEEMKGPLIEQEFWNFDALFAAQDHPAREDSDILLIKEPEYGELADEEYVNNIAQTHEDGWITGSRGHQYKWSPKKASRLLLRPQGTSVSARTLSKLTPPAKYFSIARCFRPDQVDATHAIEFNQTEGIICDPDITFRDLLGMLKTFAVEVAGAQEVRFRPDFYPFTSPSVELSAKHPVLGYIEFGGAGIFRPEVTKPFGIDYPVLAWGLGVGRLFMTKYNINDIRELFSQNLNWLRQERVASRISMEGN